MEKLKIYQSESQSGGKKEFFAWTRAQTGNTTIQIMYYIMGGNRTLCKRICPVQRPYSHDVTNYVNCFIPRLI